MKKIFIIFIFGLFVVSCKSKNMQKGLSIQSAGYLKTNQDSVILLNGGWAVDNQEMVTVFKDSKIRGSEEENIEWYPFKIKNDTIIIDYGDNLIGKNIILKLANDTLTLKHEDGSISTLIRQK